MTPVRDKQHPLVNETVLLQGAQFEGTRYGHVKWEGWAEHDGQPVRVVLFREDALFLGEFLGVDLTTKPGAGKQMINRQVVLCWEQKHGYRIKGAFVGDDERFYAVGAVHHKRTGALAEAVAVRATHDPAKARRIS